MQKHLFRVGILVTMLLMLVSMSVVMVSSADDDWQATYYNNTTLTGDPVLSGRSAEIDYNWGEDAPGTGVNSDNFSVRWTKTTTLPAGRYRLTLTSDDGSRAFVNNRLITNQWWAHDLRTASGEYNHPGGELTLRVEFFEKGDKAVISFDMQRVGNTTAATPRATGVWATNTPVAGQSNLSTCTSGNWFGNYWNNAFLSGAPVRSQNVGHINYNWGEGAPLSGINSNHWSASWTTTVDLARGRYRFTLTSNDGSTLWVNNWHMINMWYDHDTLTRSREVNHPGGPVTLRIEYYDKEGPANLSFSCARVADLAPTATWPRSTATPIATATPLPPTATPLPPTATPDPLLSADAGQCIISNIYILNLRSAPSISSAIIMTIRRGDVTTRTGNTSGAWVQIRTFDNEIGWINGFYCGEGEAPVSNTPTPTVNHICAVEVDALLIRSGPSTGNPFVGIVYRGEPMELTGKRNAAGTWVSVVAPDGTRGWVFAQHLGVPASVISQLTVSN